MKLEKLDALVRDRESTSRYEHTLRVRDFAVDMAKRFGVSPKKTARAALWHDFCKDKDEEGNALSHAGKAADIMYSEYGVTDEEVLDAVRYHTTGRAGMSLLEMIIFVSDKLERGRTYDEAEMLRELAQKDPYECALVTLKYLAKYLENKGETQSPDSVAAIKWLEKRKKKMKRRGI